MIKNPMHLSTNNLKINLVDLNLESYCDIELDSNFGSDSDFEPDDDFDSKLNYYLYGLNDNSITIIKFNHDNENVNKNDKKKKFIFFNKYFCCWSKRT